MFIPEKIKRNTKKKQNRRFYYIDSNPDLKNEPKLPKKRITQNCPPKGISRVGNSDIHRFHYELLDFCARGCVISNVFGSHVVYKFLFR